MEKNAQRVSKTFVNHATKLGNKVLLLSFSIHHVSVMVMKHLLPQEPGRWII